MVKKKDNTWLWLIGGAAALLLLSNKSPAASLFTGGGGSEGGGYVSAPPVAEAPAPGAPSAEPYIPPEIPPYYPENDFVTIDYGEGLTHTLPIESFYRLIGAIEDRPAKLARFEEFVTNKESYPTVSEYVAQRESTSSGGGAPPAPAPSISVPSVWSPHYTLGNAPWGLF